MSDKEILKHLCTEFPEFKVVEDMVEIKDKEQVEDVTICDIYFADEMIGIVIVNTEGEIKLQKLEKLIDSIKKENDKWNKIENQEKLNQIKKKLSKNQSSKNQSTSAKNPKQKPSTDLET